MSRQSPTGFAFSMFVEIAAVVIIVSLLPRFDLRPAASAAGLSPAQAFRPPSLLTSFEPTNASRPLPAPPLVESTSPDPKYIEQRLDRASQQLVNSLGSAVTHATGNLMPAAQPTPSITISPSPVNPPSFAERQLTLMPPRDIPLSAATTGSFPTQPRPWLRY